MFAKFLILSAKVTKGKTARLIYQTKIMNEQVQQKSWFSRNWMWAVPVGGCLTVILLFVLGVGTAIFGISKLFTESAPYEYALEQASNNPTVIEYLGNNIENNGLMQGNISFKNDTGKANITIPIKGTKGEGSVTIVGKKIDGEWIYEELFVTIKETSEQINLMDKYLEGI